MKIALFGGTFDPPHTGHLLIAEYILKNTIYPIDELWFVPTYNQRYFGIDPQKMASSYEVRLEMISCMSRSISNTQVSILEKEHALSGQTKDLFLWLPKENDYCFIIGTDQLVSFHRWSEYEMLLATMPFLVYPRAGYPAEPLYQNMIVIDGEAPVTNFSSTMVREMIGKGERADGIILPEVYELIQKHGLYRRSERKEQKK
jgi:nicotinate-nucleotide adenylyltransferase